MEGVRRVRGAMLCLAVALLTGCGGSGDGGGSAAPTSGASASPSPSPDVIAVPSPEAPRPDPEDNPFGRPQTPEQQRVVDALPNSGVMLGWKAGYEPSVHDVGDRELPAYQSLCAGPYEERCEGALSMGSSLFLKRDGEPTNATFVMVSYEDEEAAEAAYAAWWRQNSEFLTAPQKASVDAVGDERDALRGTNGTGDIAAVVQLRVGPTVLTVQVTGMTEGAGGTYTSDAQLSRLAGLFAEGAAEAWS
ncbi:hypothetical protein [Streptomyces sp. WMMC1477]|uniref:hypothetical protein n=1 Tax=Streptomyces sp. WMMC1477 TaxID=3015155 RepID=UPI0022B5F59B|nr:hypothetical protein [Streptomyces sp. WMMC1477]MCZ7432169.1 hypothetical protein [Streptomyces sp. WMMC1477]